MTREMYWLLFLLPIPLSYILDLLLGDPVWLYHPVRLVGSCITKMEKQLRGAFSEDETGQRAGGILLAVLIPLFFLAVSVMLLALLLWAHPVLWFALETMLCYQIQAAKSLRDESMLVYRRLAEGDLPGARAMVARIVGRDTDVLDEAGVARATVETIAENTSDGVVAPMLYIGIGGAALGMWYKAVNTLDSMVGYKNEKYRHFGTASAKQDDAANYLPARISAWLMIFAADCAGFNMKEARRIYRRDRSNHASPNSAHTEAVCAGALGLQLGGDAVYFGELHHKPTIGDATRPVDAEDIRRANKLMLFTSLGSLFISCSLRMIVILVLMRLRIL